MDLRAQHEDLRDVNEWIQFGMRIAVTSALHPVDYAKALMQLGYEPIAPQPGKSLFGRPVLFLPNVFQYLTYIKRVDGIVGCYRGLAPKVVGQIISSIGSEKIAERFGFVRIRADKRDESELSPEESEERFYRILKRDLVITISAITLAHPFQVISVRMMAQFIGNDTTYNTIWSSIKEIWNTEGIFGFFSGYTPKILCEVSCLLIASSATYMIKKHFNRDRDGLEYTGAFTTFVVGTLFYPLHVVSTCMKVVGSRLKAGQPPHMPPYTNWSHCLRELKAVGHHKRGTSLFFRYYSSQTIFRGQVPYPKVE